MNLGRGEIIFYKNARCKLFSVNYQVAEVMQQMGCGSIDIATLAGFLDLPISGFSIAQHMNQVEREIGGLKL